MQQLPLPFSPRDDATFDSFLATDATRLVVQTLRYPADSTGYSLSYLHGPLGSGRSHLLQALCHYYHQRGERAQYLPLARLCDSPAQQVMARLESHAVVCIDDLDCVAGRPDWEVELFNFFNRKLLLAGTVAVAAPRPPERVGFQMPDLVSRLQQGLVLALPEPDDDHKARVLVWRARQRGIVISPRVAQFVLTHSGRDLYGLMRLLDDIDAVSLLQQRRVTVPFMRELLQRR